MEKLRIALLLTLIVALAACGDDLLASQDRATPAELKAAMDAGTAVALDVRHPVDWLTERIKGALNIPLYELETRVSELPKDKRIITYCA